MKKFLFGLSLTLIGLRAQSTNIDIRIRTFEPTVTNQVTITLTSYQAQAFQLAYLRDVQTAVQQTNTPPTFWQSVTNELRAFLLDDLNRRGVADDEKTNKLDQIAIQAQSVWPTLNASNRNVIKTLLNIN